MCPIDEVERMVPQTAQSSRRVWLALYGLLNPIPFGLFVGALAFDIAYFRTGEILWDKAAAWLIPLGLIVAIVPRLIDLGLVGLSRRGRVTRIDRLDFGLNLVAVIAAIVNAFVHSRDAYGSMPTGMWLSLLTVVLIAAGYLMKSWRISNMEAYARD
jgi:uncharacterized membrane protein